jgi:hypothetical protein
LGREHTVDDAEPPGYDRLQGGAGAGGSVRAIVRHAPALAGRAWEVLAHLEAGLAALPEILGLPAPELEALVVADADREAAPRDNHRPYPRGLPYFTRAADPPALVIPEKLSEAVQPRTLATLPLVVHHELAHAFLAGEVATRTPGWLRELPPQAASAAVARREGLPLDEHLAQIPSPGFTVRGFRTPAGAEDQMAFQNLLLKLGAAMLEEFGEVFLPRLVGALRRENEVSEARAEELLAAALGEGGREWLASREEF